MEPISEVKTAITDAQALSPAFQKEADTLQEYISKSLTRFKAIFKGYSEYVWIIDLQDSVHPYFLRSDPLSYL